MMNPQHTDVYPASSSQGHSGHGPLSPGFGRDRSMRPFREIAGRGPGRGRFVTQSHVLSAPLARPASLAIAAAVAVALVLVTRRLTH